MSETRMLSYEIDALAADRFKASWERMVLLASTLEFRDYYETTLPSPDRDHDLITLEVMMVCAELNQNGAAPTWPRTASERRWLSPSDKGQTE